MTEWHKHVLPHSDLVNVAENLWQVTGRLPRGNMPRNMVIHKLPDGTTLLHSVIALDDSGIRRLEAIGKPSVIVVPNGLHRLDAAVYKERYPNIKVACPESAWSAVQRKVAVDITCEELLPKLGIRCIAPDGIRFGELVYDIPTGTGRSLVVTDLLFNLTHQPGLDGLIFKLIGSSGFFGITGIGRWLMLQNRQAFKNWLGSQAQRSDLVAICVGHGGAIVGDCSTKLRSAADRL